MSRPVALGSALAAVLGGWLSLEAVSAAPAEDNTFEGLARTAAIAPDPDALAAPFAEDCARARREIDRARCRGTQNYLRGSLPEKLMHAVIDSPRVASVSGYDAGVKGYRMKLVGCLTCDEPATGPEGESLYLTFAAPGKKAASLREAVILAEAKVNFPDLDAGRAFEKTVKPNLRAEFVFRGDGTPWSFQGRRGVAFTPVGMRIFDRCTGEVFFSQPRSAGRVEVAAGLPGCEREVGIATNGSAGRDKEGKEGIEDAPEKLGPLEITTALRGAQTAIEACNADWKWPGKLEIELELAGTGGRPQAVRAKGGLGGTPVAHCVLNAVRATPFPRFQQARQTFSYSVRLGDH
jgi:hypothetical protein